MDRNETQTKPAPARAARQATQTACYHWTALGCAVVLAAALSLGFYHIVVPARLFLPMHIVLELFSIVISFSVFATGWYGFRQSANPRDLIVAVAFLVAGAMDFAHTLSYRGMPGFIVAPSAGLAAAYWLAARLAVGLGLLWSALVDPESRPLRSRPGMIVAGAVALVLVIIGLVSANSRGVALSIFDPSRGGLTALKTVMESAAIVVYALAFVFVSQRRKWDSEAVLYVRSALIIAAAASIAFTQYVSPYDWMNAVGHVLKTIAYFLILQGLFVYSIKKPYDQLSSAKEELQNLYRDAEAHRREMEVSFSRVGNALSSSLKLDEALNQIAALAADMLHATCSIVAIIDKTGEAVTIAARTGCVDSRRTIDLARSVGAKVASTRQTIVRRSIEKCDSSECSQAMLCSPMVHQGDVLGVIAIYSHDPSAFDERDIRMLEGFATHAAVAIHNAMSYEHESKIADVLQRSFLTSSTIVTDRFEIALVYEPAMNESLVGGDFYDVIELGCGRIALSIGDVSGKGLRAAVHTAMIKYALRAYMIEGRTPAEALALLNRMVIDFTDPETFITMFLGILNVETGDMVYVNAGHEPPIHASEGTFLSLPPTGPALGISGDMSFEQGILSIGRNGTLFLYTDGISEARSGHSFLGVEGIGEEILVCQQTDAHDLARCVHRQAVEFAGGELKDDAAILAVRATG